MDPQRQIGLSESALRRYVADITDRTASDVDLFTALVRAHLLAEGGELFDVLRVLVEEASTIHEREHLHPDHDTLDVFDQWIAQRAWITECLAAAIVHAPPRMKEAGVRIIQQIDEKTSWLRGEAAAERLRAGNRNTIVAPHTYTLKKQ
jgi:hypothetical protein